MGRWGVLSYSEGDVTFLYELSEFYAVGNIFYAARIPILGECGDSYGVGKKSYAVGIERLDE